MVLRVVLGIDAIAEEDKPLYDVNNDENMNLADALFVLRAALGITSLYTGNIKEPVF